METTRVLHNLHPIDTPVGEFGSTVRKGLKWADANGQFIELCVCTNDPETHYIAGGGYVTEVWTGLFWNIPARLIEIEHKKEARTYLGLLEGMRSAYGPSFETNELVTILVYRRMR